jgi:hypothetical protein
LLAFPATASINLFVVLRQIPPRRTLTQKNNKKKPLKALRILLVAPPSESLPESILYAVCFVFLSSSSHYFVLLIPSLRLS